MRSYEVKQRLLAHGWSEVSGGHFSEVYSRPDRDYVIKIVDGSDEDGPQAYQDGYLAFASWLKGAPQRDYSKHFPKIRGLHVDYDDDDRDEPWYLAAIEKLKEPGKTRYWSSSSPRTVFETRADTLARSMRGYIRQGESSPGTLKRALAALRPFLDDWRLDLHGGNWMLRPTPHGDQVVITDPLSFPK